MSSPMLGKALREDSRREIERRIEELRQKYGMNYDELFEATEDLKKFEELMRRGFDPKEILDDINEWEELLDKLEEENKRV